MGGGQVLLTLQNFHSTARETAEAGQGPAQRTQAWLRSSLEAQMSIKFQSVFKTWLVCKAGGHNRRQLEEQDRKAEKGVESTFLHRGEGEGIELEHIGSGLGKQNPELWVRCVRRKLCGHLGRLTLS